MGKIRFVLKHKVTSFFRCMFRRRRSTAARYRRLNPLPIWGSNPITKILSWTRCLKTKARAICCSGSGRGFVKIGQEPVVEKPTVAVPKGHLAVYVGQKDDYERVLVPVIYFNHPLFSELLREVEDEYGFNHTGGITIPCRISEFERVQTRIKQGGGSGRKMVTWK